MKIKKLGPLAAAALLTVLLAGCGGASDAPVVPQAVFRVDHVVVEANIQTDPYYGFRIAGGDAGLVNQNIVITSIRVYRGGLLWEFPAAQTTAGAPISMQWSGTPTITPPAATGDGGPPPPEAAVPFTISGRTSGFFGVDVVLPLQAGDRIYVTGSTAFAVGLRGSPWSQMAAAVQVQDG